MLPFLAKDAFEFSLRHCDRFTAQYQTPHSREAMANVQWWKRSINAVVDSESLVKTSS